MATQVLRFETRDQLDWALLRHCAGESRPDHARPHKKNTLFHDDREGASSRLAALLHAREGTRGRQPKNAVDQILAGPPRYAADDAWDDQKVSAWAEASYAWLRDTFPSCPLAIIALHTDEASPHMHAVMVPETDDGRLSWTDVKPAASGQKRNHYRHIQDNYHERVGKRFGLDRGERGSTRKHKPLSREAGEALARDELEKGRRLQARLAEAADLADAAGRPARADAIRRAADDPDRGLEGIAAARDAERKAALRDAFERDRRAALARHEAELAALAEERATAEAELKGVTAQMAATRDRLKHLEELALKKPWGFGTPLAPAGEMTRRWFLGEAGAVLGIAADRVPAHMAMLQAREHEDARPGKGPRNGIRINKYGYLEMWIGDGIKVPCTSNVGGGSHIWAALLERAPQGFWDDRAIGLGDETLSLHYNRVERELKGIKPRDTSAVPNLADEAWSNESCFAPLEDGEQPLLGILFPGPDGDLSAITDESGIVREPLDVNRDNGMFGSPGASKPTVDALFLLPALSRGLTVRDMHEVRRVSADKAGGWTVEARDLRGGRNVTLAAPKLAVCAGTMNTNALLLSSRDTGGLSGLAALGKGLGANGDLIGKWPVEDRDTTIGPPSFGRVKIRGHEDSAYVSISATTRASIPAIPFIFGKAKPMPGRFSTTSSRPASRRSSAPFPSSSTSIR